MCQLHTNARTDSPPRSDWYLGLQHCLTLLLALRLLQSNSTSATFSASSNMEILKSEEPQPSCVEPSYRQHSPKRATAFTPGWPVCRVQQVRLWQENFVHVRVFPSDQLTCAVALQATLCPWRTWCLCCKRL